MRKRQWCQLQVGDLVRRKNIASWRSRHSRRRAIGIVLSQKQSLVKSSLLYVKVFWPTLKETNEYAETLIEVVNKYQCVQNDD